MKINRDRITTGLSQLLDQIFLPPEVEYAKVRDVIIKRENRTEKILTAIEKGYHDCYSDVDLSIMSKLSPDDPITQLEYMKRIDRFGIFLEDCLGITFDQTSRIYRIILRMA